MSSDVHGHHAGSLCKLRLLKATLGEPVEVPIRRARADVVQVCSLVEQACQCLVHSGTCNSSQMIRDLWKQEQETAFEYLTALKNHAVQTNDAERASLTEKLGRQFVRILLDRQDKELALSMQHQGLQENSMYLLEEIHSEFQKMAAAHGTGDFAGNQHVAELEEEVSRHIALEEEAS